MVSCIRHKEHIVKGQSRAKCRHTAEGGLGFMGLSAGKAISYQEEFWNKSPPPLPQLQMGQLTSLPFHHLFEDEFWKIT